MRRGTTLLSAVLLVAVVVMIVVAVRAGGNSISGVVIDAHGAPVPSFEIRVDRPSGRAFSKLSTSCARADLPGDGSFVIEGLDAGPHVISVVCPIGQTLHRSRIDAHARDVKLVARFGTVKLRVHLPAGGRHPLNAWVVAQTSKSPVGTKDPPRWWYANRLGGLGNGPGPFSQSDVWDAELRVFEPGTCRVLIAADDYAMAVRSFQLADGVSVDLGDVKRDLGLSLAGRVEDEAGRAVAGAFVASGDLSTFGSPGERHTKTDADGAFRLDHLARGTHDVFVHASESASVLVRADVADDASPLRVRIGRGEKVTAVVVDAAAEPIADAHVQVQDARDDADGFSLSFGTTDVRGACAMRVSPGDRRVSVEGEAVFVNVEVVAGGETSVRLVVK